jgi:hypothetical protein
MAKAVNPQFKSAHPQLRNIADNQIDCGVVDLKKLRNCDCGASKFDFRNSATLCSLLSCQFRYFLVPFSQLRMNLKINEKIFLELSVSLETKNLP